MTNHQSQQIEKVVELVRKHAPELVEMIGETKWAMGKVVFKYPEYQNESDFVYMVGPLKNGKTSFHLMPLYALSELRQKYAAELEALNFQKSCINFTDYEELPEDVFADIIRTGTTEFKQVYEQIKGKK